MTGDELRKRRIRLVLTQAELAARLEVATNTVARWERGERAIPLMIRQLLVHLEEELLQSPDDRERRTTRVLADLPAPGKTLGDASDA